jgi:uncharacterized protein (DUF433 family)
LIYHDYIVSNQIGESEKMVDEPTYNFSEASKYLRIPVATLRSWILGRDYPKGESSAFFEPLIKLPESDSRLLSFNNLAEAYVLRSLRHKHLVSIKDVRKALEYAFSDFNIKRLLLSQELLTAAGQLFIDRYGKLINLSRSGQLALKLAFENHLQRIEWKNELPVRIYPFIDADTDKLIAIDPSIQFGRPIIIKKCVLTSIIVDRIDAGETPEYIARDYDINLRDVEMAIRYEQAA